MKSKTQPEKSEDAFWGRVAEAARKVARWPAWKRNLSNLGSHYPSQFQPIRGPYERDKGTEKW